MRNSVCHSATICANAIMHAGTTVDTFLRENLVTDRPFVRYFLLYMVIFLSSQTAYHLPIDYVGMVKQGDKLG